MDKTFEEVKKILSLPVIQFEKTGDKELIASQICQLFEPKPDETDPDGVLTDDALASISPGPGLPSHIDYDGGKAHDRAIAQAQHQAEVEKVEAMRIQDILDSFRGMIESRVSFSQGATATLEKILEVLGEKPPEKPTHIVEPTDSREKCTTD